MVWKCNNFNNNIVYRASKFLSAAVDTDHGTDSVNIKHFDVSLDWLQLCLFNPVSVNQTEKFRRQKQSIKTSTYIALLKQSSHRRLLRVGTLKKPLT